MQRYIGLDAHAASGTLAIITETGKRLRDFPVETNGAALVEAIRAIPSPRHLIFEEGTHSAWLYETLAPHVEEIVVIGVRTSTLVLSGAIGALVPATHVSPPSVDTWRFPTPPVP